MVAVVDVCVAVVRIGCGICRDMMRGGYAVAGAGKDSVLGGALMRACAGAACLPYLWLHVRGTLSVWLHLFALALLLHNPVACLPLHRICSSTVCK
jgi:hypothetical protein